MPELAKDTAFSDPCKDKMQEAVIKKRKAVDALTHSGFPNADFKYPRNRALEIIASATHPDRDHLLAAVLGEPRSANLRTVHMSEIPLRRLQEDFIRLASAEWESERTFTRIVGLAADKAWFSPIVINEIAKQRIQGYEKLVDRLYSAIRHEAKRLEVAIARINLRPEWSNEYETQTGVVIDIEISANNDVRFALWDRVSERLNQLLDQLLEKEQAFLIDNISVVVTQG